MKWLRKQALRLFFLMGTVLLIGGCAFENGKELREESTEEQTGTEESGQAFENKSPKIGVSIYRYDDNFMKQYRLELKQYLEETYHAEVIMRNAGGDQEEQNRQAEQFLLEGCCGMIINPVEVSAAGGIADAAARAGVPVVFINRLPGEEEQRRWKEKQMAVSCVGTDSRQAGTYQGEILLETPDKGDFNGDKTVSYVMLMGEKDNEDSRFRAEYSIKALEDRGMKTEELFSGHGDWNQEKGKKLAKAALDSFGTRIEVIFCCNDAMAAGALEAVEEAGRKNGKDIRLLGVDALRKTVLQVKEGRITGTVFNDHEGQSHTAADVLMKMVGGEEAEVKYLVDYIKITTISTFHK